MGIAAESCEPGCSLSKHVKAVLDQAITAILSELDRSAVGYRLRESATKLDACWIADEKIESLLT